MNLRIIKGGVLDTIQDMGRYGCKHLGINPGGAMDKKSAQLANILVGNDPMDPVIELHFPASEFFFEQPALIAIAGADFSAHINGEEVGGHQPVLLSKYSILQFHRPLSGARAYLAIRGSFEIQEWLKSRSTHLKAGFGGFKGRSLQQEDEIPLGSSKDLCNLVGKKEFMVLPWRTDPLHLDRPESSLYVLEGPEWEKLDASSKERFLSSSYTITHHSDRMGFQLDGPLLKTENQVEILSSPVDFGTVQLLHSGQLIILMADHQTTGGYPRVASVIGAHHSKVAQMKAGQRIRFQFIKISEAEKMWKEEQRSLMQMKNAISFKLENFFKDEK